MLTMLHPQIHFHYPYVTMLADSTSFRLPDNPLFTHAPPVMDAIPLKVGDASLLPSGRNFTVTEIKLS